MMAGLLLARQGIDVVVCEKYPDFFRDFRGDTIHPSTLELVHELGLRARVRHGGQPQAAAHVSSSGHRIALTAAAKHPQNMIAAYREPDRERGRQLMRELIDSVSHSVPRALNEVITLGVRAFRYGFVGSQSRQHRAVATRRRR